LKLSARIALLFISALVLMPFQNCTRYSFKSLTDGLALNSSGGEVSGNGGGYDGKLQGSYFRFIPDFTCEGKKTFKELIEVVDSKAYLFENTIDKCATDSIEIPLESLALSPFQSEVISRAGHIYERFATSPSQVPDSFQELVCRDDFANPNFEILVRYDQNTNTASTTFYSADTNSTDPSSVRAINNSLLEYSSYAGELRYQVNLNQPDPQAPSNFKGQITFTSGNWSTKVKSPGLTCAADASLCSVGNDFCQLDFAFAPTSLILKSPTSSFEASNIPVITVSPVVTGATVSLYSDASCTNLLGTQIATSSVTDVTASLGTPATYFIYANQVDKSGNKSTCSTSSVRYSFAKSFNVTATTAALNPDALIDGLCQDASGKCSLRAAFDEMAADATSPYLLNLEAGTYIVNTGFASPFSSVKLRGASENTTILQGNNTSFLFRPSSGSRTVIALENVQVNNFAANVAGYDIFWNSVTSGRSYYIKNVMFKSNSASGGGEAVILADTVGAAELENVLFEGNSGAISAFYKWGGTTRLKNVFFKDNTTTYSARIRFCDANLDNVTVKGGSGIGIHLDYPNTVNMQNTTISDVGYSGLYISGFFTSIVNIYNSTFYNNGANANGNLEVFAGSADIYINVYNSIFAINSSKANCNFTAGSGVPILNFKNSLFDEASCTSAASNLVGVNPQLGALSSPSAYIGIRVPMLTSPAIDAGDNSTCTIIDQTGLSRPINKLGGPTNCDIGSVEVP
jgi:hypothetical protein